MVLAKHVYLYILKVYQRASGRKDLYGTIELLKKTSILVTNFKDPRTIKSVKDPRLAENDEVLHWFKEWEEEQRSQKNCFITRESFEDLNSMVVGFKQIIVLKMVNNPLGFIQPNCTNSDVVENVFCSERGICHGSSTNPTYLQFAKGMNTIIIGQPLRSKKSNAGSEKQSCISGALPYKLHVKESFSKLKL